MQVLGRKLKKVMTVFSVAAGIAAAAGWLVFRFEEVGGWSGAISCGIAVFLVTFPFALYAGEKIMSKAFAGRLEAEGFFADSWKFLELSGEIDTIIFDRSLVAAEDRQQAGGLRLKENSAEALIMISGLGLKTVILSEEGECREDFLMRRAGAGHVALYNHDNAGEVIAGLLAESRLAMAVYPEGAGIYRSMKRGIRLVMGSSGADNADRQMDEDISSLVVYTETKNLMAAEKLLLTGKCAEGSIKLRIFIYLAITAAALPFAVWGVLGPAGALAAAALSAGAGLINIIFFRVKSERQGKE